MPLIGDFVDLIAPVARSTPGADVFERFQAEPNTLALAVVDSEGRPVGLIERNAFTLRMAAEFGRALYARWAAQVIAWGGSISAEHGIGKLKRDLFRQMAGDAALAQMRALKKRFDPDGLLNPGTLLETP